MIEASVPGATRFRSSIPWAFVMMVVSMALALTGASLGLNLIFGTSHRPDSGLYSPILAATAGAVLESWHTQRRR